MSTKAGRKLNPEDFSSSAEQPKTRSDDFNLLLDIDRVVEILRSLPMLRRYGGDTEALNEAREILEKLRAAL